MDKKIESIIQRIKNQQYYLKLMLTELEENKNSLESDNVFTIEQNYNRMLEDSNQMKKEILDLYEYIEE